MTVWAVTTTHDPAELGDAQRVAAGLPELLAALAGARGLSAGGSERRALRGWVWTAATTIVV